MLSFPVSALPSQIEAAGAIAGIASFVVMLALLGLYIFRALELRKLRRTMPFLVDPGSGNGKPTAPSGRGTRLRGRNRGAR